MNIKYKLQPDAVDLRDYIYHRTDAPIRDYVDLRQWASPVENQLNLGSCAANAISGNYELLLNMHYKDQYKDLSSLFVYYNARVLEHNIKNDSGITLRSGMKSVDNQGICTESIWPYNVNNFDIEPPVVAYIDAKSRMLQEYRRTLSIYDILDAVNNNMPVVLGMMVYEPFNYMDSENFILSNNGNENELGGHAVCIVGYDNINKLVLAKNSYGENWGDKGYFWITFDYVNTNMIDSWVFIIQLQPT